jgi:prevent-host-death family protein
MKTKTTLSISEARKKFFTIAEEVQSPDTYYTLTERGKPKAVIVSAARFEALVERQAQVASEQSVRRIFEDVFRERKLLLREVSRPYGEESAQGQAFLLREEPKALYLSGNVTDRLYHIRELAKAQLYIELVEKYRYPVETVEIGRCVKVGGQGSRRYIEADIIIEEKRSGVLLLFAVAAPQAYQSHLPEAMRELFELASAFLVKRSTPVYLVYYTRSSSEGRSRRQCLVVECSKYKTFENWEAAGRPSSSAIPTYQTLLVQGKD